MSANIRLNSADPAVTQEARLLYRRGRTPVGLDGKKPTRPDWQQYTYANEVDVIAEFTSLIEGSNLGVVLGRGLADVDLDCPESIRAASHLLPRTPRQSGRESAPRSHWWYSTKADREMFFQLKDAFGEVVVELRADSGHQTVVPPSVHPDTGEPYRWEGSPEAEPAEVDLGALGAAVAALGLVAILAPHWPRGSRHEAYLALVGGLLRGHPDDERLVGLVEKIVQALAHLTNDEEHRVRVTEALPSTRKRLRVGDGQQVTGWTTLREHVAGEHVTAAMKAADRMRECLELGSPSVQVRDAPTCAADHDRPHAWCLACRRLSEEVNQKWEAQQGGVLADRWLTGEALFDVPLVTPIWGTEEKGMLSALGQGWKIAAPNSVGKTSIGSQYTKARLGLDGWAGEMWGLPVVPLQPDERVIYLAMDRTLQIQQSLARGVNRQRHPEIADRLRIYPGPPPYRLSGDMGQQWMLDRVEEFNAKLVVVDSRKDLGEHHRRR